MCILIFFLNNNNSYHLQTPHKKPLQSRQNEDSPFFPNPDERDAEASVEHNSTLTPQTKNRLILFKLALTRLERETKKSSFRPFWLCFLPLVKCRSPKTESKVTRTGFFFFLVFLFFFFFLIYVFLRFDSSESLLVEVAPVTSRCSGQLKDCNHSRLVERVFWNIRIFFLSKIENTHGACRFSHNYNMEESAPFLNFIFFSCLRIELQERLLSGMMERLIWDPLFYFLNWYSLHYFQNIWPS